MATPTPWPSSATKASRSGSTRSPATGWARRLWSDLIRVGIDEEEVGEQLETEGIDRFAASYQALIDTIEAKRAEASG